MTYEMTHEQQTLFNENIFYASRVARRFCIKNGIPPQDDPDYENEALIALITGIKKYDSKLGKTLRKFLLYHIMYQLADYRRRADKYTRAMRKQIREGTLHEVRVNDRYAQVIYDSPLTTLISDEFWNSVPSEYRDLIWAHYRYGKSFTKIAEERNVSPSAIAQMFRRIRPVLQLSLPLTDTCPPTAR